MSASGRSSAPLVHPTDDAPNPKGVSNPPAMIAPGARTFFEKSPSARIARAIYLKTYFGGTLMMVIMLFTIFPIYWGALYRTPVRNLKGWVVDFDGGFVGETVSQALVSNQGTGRIEWEVVPASRFLGGPEGLAAAIKNEDAWAAVSINPGSSDRLSAALASPDPSYDGAKAVTGYGVEARNENALRNLIRPALQGNLDAITKQLSQQVAQNASTSPSISAILAASPQTIVTPVSYTINNLIPFDQPVATAATFAGMLYQLILGFFVVMLSFGAREASGLNRTLSTKGLIILRLCSSFFAYFIISLFYCLMNLAFHIDVNRKFGHAGFIVFWMVNYIGMLAMALALESLITLLTPRGMPFVMLTWIITNLAVILFPIDALPAIYRYGYAAPSFNLSRALRSIIFGTRNRVGQSVGILFAWIVISCITLSFIQWWVRRKQGAAPSVGPMGSGSGHGRSSSAPSEKSADGTVGDRDTPNGEDIIKHLSAV